MNSSITTVQDYIASFPPDVGKLLEQVREIILEIAPSATESISYGMPAYKLGGPLAYFAGYKNHIGFYPTPAGLEAFKEDLAPYKTGKGSVQFPLDAPLPVQLIRKIVVYRMGILQSKPARKKNNLIP